MLGSRPDAVGRLIRCRCHVRPQRGLPPPDQDCSAVDQDGLTGAKSGIKNRQACARSCASPGRRTGTLLAALAYRFSGSNAVVPQMLAAITSLVQAPPATPGCEDSRL